MCPVESMGKGRSSFYYGMPLQGPTPYHFRFRVLEILKAGQTRLNDQPRPRDLPVQATRSVNNLGYSSADSRVVEPDKMRVVLGADMSRVRTAENPYATLTGRDPLPPERHFGYALTWWGMALGLIGVYIAFHRSQGRLRFGGSS